MIDYSDLDNASLNRLVAERQGYPEHGLCAWANDLNAAAALDYDDKHWLDIKRYSHGTYAEVHSESAGLIADTFDVIEARARTIAWLLYMDTMDVNAP